LAGQGHDLDRLLDGYPTVMVKGLLAASQACRRHRLAEHTVALTVAVTGALDLALNQGKGKVLERWLQEVSNDGQDEPSRKRPKMSDRAFSFFAAMPRRNPKSKPRI
jgi:hypothetical protein